MLRLSVGRFVHAVEVEEEEALGGNRRRYRTDAGAPPGRAATNKEQAKRHLWMHFTRMGPRCSFPPAARGRGRARQPTWTVWRRLLRQRGPRARPGARVAFYVMWGARPPARDRAGRQANCLTCTGATNRVFFTAALGGCGVGLGSHAGANGEGQRHKLLLKISAPTLGALASQWGRAAHAVRAARARRRARAEHLGIATALADDRRGDRVRGAGESANSSSWFRRGGCFVPQDWVHFQPVRGATAMERGQLR